MVGKNVGEKLRDHNYKMWRTKMELILERLNLKGFVNGFETIMSSKPKFKRLQKYKVP